MQNATFLFSRPKYQYQIAYIFKIVKSVIGKYYLVFTFGSLYSFFRKVPLQIQTNALADHLYSKLKRSTPSITYVFFPLPLMPHGASHGSNRVRCWVTFGAFWSILMLFPLQIPWDKRRLTVDSDLTLTVPIILAITSGKNRTGPPQAVLQMGTHLSTLNGKKNSSSHSVEI